MLYILQYSAPLLSSNSLSPVSTEWTRINVPFSEADPTHLPDEFKDKATTSVL